MDPLLLQELRRDEGLRLTAYKDSLGYWTIGVGHLLGSRARMTDISIDEAEALLIGDVEEAVALVDDLFQAVTFLKYFRGARYRALVNMAFNLGSKLRQFKNFRAAVLKEDWTRASAEMLNSLWAKQVGVRAKRLAYMIEHNSTQSED